MNSNGKATPGSRFKPPSAAIWNNMVDAGRAFADGQLSSGAPQPTRPPQTNTIKLKNSSGENRRKGEILKIDGKVITDLTAEHIWLDGLEPTDDCRFGILKAPAETGDPPEIVEAQLSGVCLALVNIGHVAHRRASAVEGEFVLQSGFSGPVEIQYAPSGTGEHECVVRIGVVTETLIVEMTTTVGPGKAGTGKVMRIANDRATLADGDDITIEELDPPQSVVVVNFRPNRLAQGVAYLAHPLGGFLVVENDACFQDFMA